MDDCDEAGRTAEGDLCRKVGGNVESPGVRARYQCGSRASGIGIESRSQSDLAVANERLLAAQETMGTQAAAAQRIANCDSKERIRATAGPGDKAGGGSVRARSDWSGC